MELLIRKATQDDLDAAEEIYLEVLENEEKNGSYTNWQRGLYPTREVAEDALKKDTLYMGIADGKAAGWVILNHVQPAEYAKLSWAYPAEGEEVLVIHTLCIRPSFAGHGFGKKFVSFSEQTARTLGCRVIRLDTYEKNLPAIGMYTGLGYRYVGETDFNFHNVIQEVLKCYEKEIAVE